MTGTVAVAPSLVAAGARRCAFDILLTEQLMDPMRASTRSRRYASNALGNNRFCSGPAGSARTLTRVGPACRLLHLGRIDAFIDLRFPLADFCRELPRDWSPHGADRSPSSARPPVESARRARNRFCRALPRCAGWASKPGIRLSQTSMCLPWVRAERPQSAIEATPERQRAPGR